MIIVGNILRKIKRRKFKWIGHIRRTSRS